MRSDLNLQICFSYKNRDKYNIALAILLSLNTEYIFLLDILLYLSVSMRCDWSILRPVLCCRAR